MVLAVDITKWDIYQCDKEEISKVDNVPYLNLVDQFAGSAKCHKETNNVTDNKLCFQALLSYAGINFLFSASFIPVLAG